MKYTITIHKVIAIVSFLILSAVQFFLVYNTYELKNKQFYLQEKDLIKKEYSLSVQTDLIFPGGARILDTAMYRNLGNMEQWHKAGDQVFSIRTQQLLDSTARALHKGENLDSLLQFIRKKYAIQTDLTYGLAIDVLEVSFGNRQYIPIYNKEKKYPGINDSLQHPGGLWLGGDLDDVNENNKIVTVSVGGINDRNYRVAYSFYVDTRNRKMAILHRMMPTFALSVFSILVVVLLFFITLRNWIRQKKLSEMKSDFINSITHELHTPLAAIIVANRTLQNDKMTVTRETVQPLTEVIERQSNRLKTLISQVLDITSMNQINLKKEPLGLHHLLEEILLDYRLKLAGAPIQLTLEKNAARDAVHLDQFWFTTALQNILDNAIKYNRQEFKEITVTTTNDKKNILLSIVDNGIGMNDETQQHLFDKFYRGVSTLHGEAKGLGLGMYYVKQTVEAHHWKIDVESREGAGTMITITIPLA
ncbi:HAMP domain-containing sensor histidine kinase [Paraflavitalea sp. CAU 1676]|uniref:sensor histidine kinase n=1 Tax=Paraflavitalea sp. CAU 1676 TaxID=3032598 RepID=UPI0023DAA645|nr:HAMP domain-containing sensor histidine kinase [Paraflavitalea sp. CAU 1676]MDF2188830.1 HAMP domain-containing sensor histidine kinase [Paraflavitalea sp. CAU 1676]